METSQVAMRCLRRIPSRGRASSRLHEPAPKRIRASSRRCQGLTDGWVMTPLLLMTTSIISLETPPFFLSSWSFEIFHEAVELCEMIISNRRLVSMRNPATWASSFWTWDFVYGSKRKTLETTWSYWFWMVFWMVLVNFFCFNRVFTWPVFHPQPFGHDFLGLPTCKGVLKSVLLWGAFGLTLLGGILYGALTSVYALF